MINERILGLLNKCDILFENELVSSNLVMSTFSNYLVDLLDSAEKRTGLIYHTGSPIFDILLTLYIALACLVYDESSPQELVDSLKPRDLVIYIDGNQKTRAEFIELTDNGSIKIRYGAQGKNKAQTTHTIPPALFYRIKPYQGDATILDGRGIYADTKAQIEFMQEVFGKSKNEISGENKKSAIIVCGRNFADSFIEKMRIAYSGRYFSITDLMPVSYFTENNEYRYRGNPGKVVPVLKFTNKVSYARDLVYDDTEKRVFTVAALGNQIIKTGESELPDLINRKSLKKTFLSLPIADGSGELCEAYLDASVFACTKDMLLSYSLPTEPQGPLTAALENQIENMINREIIEHTVEEIISLNEYRAFRQNIVSLRHHVQNDDLIDRFVIESYSLLNYLSTITFSIDEIECAQQTRELECPAASEKILFLESVANNYSGALSELLSSIFSVINKAYQALQTENPKERLLYAVLKKSLHIGATLILVPKAYHVDILKTLLPSDMALSENLFITTMGAFDTDKNYDSILCPSVLGTKRFSVFSTFIAPVVDCLLYPHEQPLFASQKRTHEKREYMLNSRSSIKYEVIDEYLNEQDVMDVMTNKEEIDDYLEQISLKATLQTISAASGGVATRADIVRIATTVDGESILFTRYFTPYIFDRDQMTVAESAVENIRSGDMLLFTKNSDQAKDIVEEIVKRISDSDDQIKDAYRKSKHWKERLLKYKEANHLSFQDLSSEMQEYGTPKHPVTLRTWLNPESRIIAPREEDSFYQIALICEDEEMLESPEAFHEACNTIRSLRVKILKLIGQSVIRTFQSESSETTFLSQIVREELNALSQIVHIDSIVDVSNVQVSVTYANRPYIQ